MYSNLLSAIRRTQAQMQKAQDEITTGKSVVKPSDAPSKASGILVLQQALEAREQHDRNLQHASGVLDNTDQALRDASDLLIDARAIASSQVGIGSSTETRKNQAAVIDAQIQSLIDIANRKFQDVSLFGGSTNLKNGAVFVADLGGVRYVGSRTDLHGDVGLSRTIPLNTNGIDAFAAVSTRVKSPIDLNPQATAATRLADINGATAEGFRKGSVIVNIDGTDVMVDLTNAETLGDVATRINDALTGVSAAAGSLSLSGSGFSLTANAGHTVSIREAGAGASASDLGIAITATATTVAGGDVDPRLTASTTLASLGIPIDFANGLTIVQGSNTKAADFSAATTIQDLQNVISKLDLGLRLEINEESTSLNLVSEVSGIQLSIGENGGTTAADLGLRTFGAPTLLADFRNGLGVSNPAGNDFRVQLHDGRTFDVNIDGAASVSDVIAAVTSAATTAGVTVGTPGTAGTDFNIGLASVGNGLVLEDGTAGAGEFRVQQLGESLAADHLGIYSNAGTGNTISGADNSMVQVHSVFSHLIALRDALLTDDALGITLAGGKIETDIEQLAQVRADVGVRAQQVAHQQERSADLRITEESLLSGLRDADLTEVITRFTQLQQQLQASFQVGAQVDQLSLLDFLR